MHSKNDKLRVLVLGLGNLILQDEGLGIKILQWLRWTYAWPTNVTLMDGGVMGLEILPYIEEAEAVLIIDAVRSGKPPGSLVRLDNDEIPAVIALKFSVHQVGFQETMAMAHLRGTVPKHLVLWGIEPGNIALGMTLTPPVLSKTRELTRAILDELASWGITPTHKLSHTTALFEPYQIE